MSTTTVRYAIIGLGNMGKQHAKHLLTEEIPHATLTAVCDKFQPSLDSFFSSSDLKDVKDKLKKVASFNDPSKLMESKDVDVILIATPHFDHTPLGIEALNKGFHVLIEKPISVHKADCERLLKAAEKQDVIFGAMFNQRTTPVYQKLHKLIESKELGAIRRINWIITDWFRSEAYYASGGWRATWSGEGGGVLLNQCPHQLDLWQWLFGMPSKIRSFCHLGRFHDIEVEDDVTAYMEYPNGTTGVFITTTGEAPGTNRLEIACERGKVVVENQQIQWTRNETPTSQFLKESKTLFGKPPVWNVDIPLHGGGEQHRGILKNFTNAVLGTEELLAPAVEGIHSVELANAMLYSSFIKETVELPLDSKKYEAFLTKLQKESTYIKKENSEVNASESDFSKSF